MKTLFVVCQHGDEKTPLKVIKKYFSKKVNFIIANQPAFDKNIRFNESDLNRSFPGKRTGTQEEKIAFKLKDEFTNYDQIIDFHTTTSDTEIFIITTSLDKNHLDLIRKLNISKVIYMENSIASGNALIDHIPLGLSIEVGPEGTDKAFGQIKKVFEDFLANKSPAKQEFYSVFDTLKKTSETEKLLDGIKAFKLVSKDELVSTAGQTAQVDFYPIMPREKSYVGILTLMAKKLSSKELS